MPIIHALIHAIQENLKGNVKPMEKNRTTIRILFPSVENIHPRIRRICRSIGTGSCQQKWISIPRENMLPPRLITKKTCLPWHIYITKIQSLNEPHVNSIYNFWLSQVCMASQDHQPGNPPAVCPHVWQLGTCLFDRSKQHWRRPSEWRLGVRMRRWRKPPTRST